MAQLIYPLNLKEASFPMLSSLQGRTVIGSTVGVAAAQANSPSVAYCHNVMPTKEGYESVGYLPVIAALEGGSSTPFSDVRVIYGTNKSRIYMVLDSLGSVYVLLVGATEWLAVPATSPATGGIGFDHNTVTIGTVNGETYIFYKNIGAFQFNEATNELDAVTLSGLTISETIGIIGSGGYLVAYTVNAIAWSSTIDPTDFVPSVVTGAGGGNVAGIAGKILVITGNSLGMLVHTTANILAGSFTRTGLFPWQFRVVPGGKGGISLDHIAYEAESEDQYIYSKAGLQTISYQKAEVILPEITDFLSGKVFEDFNEVTKEYVITTLTTTMKKKLKYIASRYLVISYGITEFTHALVVDIALNRVGKLKITHNDCFEYVGAQLEVAKETLAFLLADGSVSVMDVSDKTSGVGTLVVGKLEATYTRWLTILGIDAEDIKSSAEFSITILQSLDGRNTTPVSTSLGYSAAGIRKFLCKTTGNNHSLVIIGDFNLSALLVRYALAGRR